MAQTVASEGLTVLEKLAADSAGSTSTDKLEQPVDFVFLHGLNGNPKETWTSEGKTDFFWPNQILQDIPGCRVMTFGYNALFARGLQDNNITIDGIAQFLVSQLLGERRGPLNDRPLILIAHSLGGLVIKKALCNIHQDSVSGQVQNPTTEKQKTLYNAVAGLIFIGTPHTGSELTKANRAKLLLALAAATFKKPPPKLLSALAAHSDELFQLSIDFEKTPMFTRPAIEIQSYYETMTQTGAGQEVVPRHVARLGYGLEHMVPIAREHTKMTRFPNANDSVYKDILNKLKDMAEYGLEQLQLRQATYRILQIPQRITKAQLAPFLSTCENGVLGMPSHIQVHSLASRTGQSQSTKMATVTFDELPLALRQGVRRDERKQWILRFDHEGVPGSIIMDIQATFSGFTFLNDVEPEKHFLDVIALPGLGYDPFTSWQYDAASFPFMWLRDKLPELIPGAQVALYGYDTDSNTGNTSFSIQNIAISLISGLHSIGRSNPSAKPVIFLAHSFGGTVLKQCLIELANSGKSQFFMLQTVKACIFLATPNCLPKPSELAAILSSKPLAGLLQTLQAEQTRGYLSSMSGMLTGIARANQIRLCSGFETVGTAITTTEGPGKAGHESVLLLQKGESVQEGSQEADQFPIARPHRETAALEASNQAIQTIATYIDEVMASTVAANVPTTAPFAEESDSPWKVWGGEWFSRLVPYLNRGGSTQDIASSSRQSPPAVETFDDLGDDILNSSLYGQFLSTLKPYGQDREEGISPAYKGTFDWIWTNPQIGFPAWLTNDKPIFWIRGLPGSGKSTLMRYIWDNRKRPELASEGTRERPNIKAAFFFYYRGTHMQKSFEGMLHTILFRMLTLEPRLAELFLGEFAKLNHQQRTYYNWTLNKLKHAFTDILTRNKLPIDILLFIDALDEYDGPSEEIADFVQKSVHQSRQGATKLKICLSSREWEAFEQSFSLHPGFRIHDHTKGDIARYISSRFADDPTISQRLVAGTEQDVLDIREMEKSLADRANGVFIWVRAVMDEILYRVFCHNTPTSELVGYLNKVPGDLDSLYADAINRIAHEHRKEAYFLFEIMLRSDEMPTLGQLKEAVACAGWDTLEACVGAIQRCRANPPPDRWIKERGAGLVEIQSDPDRPVQFIHQTALDFLSRPGFRGIMFGHAFELPLENGYTFLSRWRFSQAEDTIRSGGALPKTGAAGSNILARAEQTTGKSMKKFISEVDIRVIQAELRGLPVKDMADPRLSFAAMRSLTNFLEEVRCASGGQIPDKGDFTLFHCLCVLAGDSPQPTGYSSRPSDISGGIFPCEALEGIAATASLLCRRGAKLDTTYHGTTPWMLLLRGLRQTKFRGANGYAAESPQINALAAVMLAEGGQDPNATITVTIEEPSYSRRWPRPGKWTSGTALHVATRDLAELLIKHGAKVNVLDGTGHTPLDLACGVTGNPYELGDHVMPWEVYPLASLLVEHGAKLTDDGVETWPIFLKNLGELAPELKAAFPRMKNNNFEAPGVLRKQTARQLVQKVRGVTAQAVNRGVKGNPTLLLRACLGDEG